MTTTDPLSLPCPWCSAAPGHTCRSVSGTRRAPHALRRYDAERQANRRPVEPLEALSRGLEAITAGIDAVDATLVPAVEHLLLDTLDYTAVAETVDWMQRTRARLATLEAYVTRELGRDAGHPDVITLPDGRRAEVLKGKDRKEWRHEDWQRDVRQAIAGTMPVVAVVNTATGEFTVDAAGSVLQEAIAKAQAVPGAGAPKVGALKSLGLNADDYCASYPGPWALKITAPNTESPTERTN